jgi:hypothetical protein
MAPVSKIDEFIAQLSQLINGGTPFQLILSKPKPNHTCKSQSIICIDHENKIAYKSVEKSATQHFTKVFSGPELLAYIPTALAQHYYYADLTSDLISSQLLQNAKGTATLINKKKQAISKESTHNSQKQYQIPENAHFLQLLGISSSQGKVYDKSQKKYRQINKFIEILDGLIPSETTTISIADMGSGKAYLTFATYYYLTEVRKIHVKLIGYELRQDLVDLCNKFAKELAYTQLTFIQANIIEAEIAPADMIISLHACDIATDMAIHAGLKSNATTMVLAPCCHKQIRKQITKTNSILKHPILLERQAELLTDAMRSLILESQGYKTKVFEFISSEHTSKNLMIIAEKDKVNPSALAELDKIKGEYGIGYHYLERLLRGEK